MTRIRKEINYMNEVYCEHGTKITLTEAGAMFNSSKIEPCIYCASLLMNKYNDQKIMENIYSKGAVPKPLSKKGWVSLIGGIVLFSFLMTFFINGKCAVFSTAEVSTCFTPGEACEKEILNEINHENKIVWVQAYYLTSRPIITAIISAKERGANVRVIVDKSQERNKRISVIQMLENHAIPVWIDNTVAIAHNKVIILGNNEVLTGSYNFTKSAQTRNAENLLIIKGDQVTAAYQHNFDDRVAHSQKFH